MATSDFKCLWLVLPLAVLILWVLNCVMGVSMKFPFNFFITAPPQAWTHVMVLHSAQPVFVSIQFLEAFLCCTNEHKIVFTQVTLC